MFCYVWLCFRFSSKASKAKAKSALIRVRTQHVHPGKAAYIRPGKAAAVKAAAVKAAAAKAAVATGKAAVNVTTTAAKGKAALNVTTTAKALAMFYYVLLCFCYGLLWFAML